MTALMVQGTSSWAGKSLLTTALARYFRRRGIKVAPFKAQNMSNNARVVDDGEIGTAQYLQALAAGVEPEVRMNPVLIKPEGDNQSQVILMGRPDLALSRMPWRTRAPHLWPAIEQSLSSLLRDFDLVLMEGAGSPAEINLIDSDHANMRVATYAGAAVLLVADIDRGGAFAHLYGTWHLLPESQRELIGGFVLNKFRGDSSLLPPAPARLEGMTGVPTVGVVPWLDHGLPDEDGAASSTTQASTTRLVAIVRYPTASNLDEFKALEQVAQVVWAREPNHLAEADLVILPGSKHVSSDLRWLKDAGFLDVLHRYSRDGGRLLAICGGLQMVGERIEDPAGVDGTDSGLGLLPLVSVFQKEKTALKTQAKFKELPEPWRALSGLELWGYEIRHGRTFPTAEIHEAISGGLGFVQGSLLGIYLHGLFEDANLVRALMGKPLARTLDETLDHLADAVVSHLDLERIEALAGVR